MTSLAEQTRLQRLLLTAGSAATPWSERRKAISALMEIASPQGLAPRITAIDYCEHAEPTAEAGPELGPIWQFWGQGLDAAPPLVRACVASVAANAGGREHIVLTAETIGNYLDLPESLIARRDFWGWTKFANFLRLLLLERHGGTWVDATVFLSAPLPEFISGSEFFVYRWNHDPRILANWLMHCTRGHPLISACRAAYERYWMDAKEPGHYFMFHFIFEAVLLSSRSLQEAWRRVPIQPAVFCHELQALLDLPFDQTRLNQILGRSPVQKLSYKTEAKPGDERTFRDYIVAGLQA